jgi:hypothetical protein
VQVLSMSAATIDRELKHARAEQGKPRRRQRGSSESGSGAGLLRGRLGRLARPPRAAPRSRYGQHEARTRSSVRLGPAVGRVSFETRKVGASEARVVALARAGRHAGGVQPRP